MGGMKYHTEINIWTLSENQCGQFYRRTRYYIINHWFNFHKPHGSQIHICFTGQLTSCEVGITCGSAQEEVGKLLTGRCGSPFNRRCGSPFNRRCGSPFNRKMWVSLLQRDVGQPFTGRCGSAFYREMWVSLLQRDVGQPFTGRCG